MKFKLLQTILLTLSLLGSIAEARQPLDCNEGNSVCSEGIRFTYYHQVLTWWGAEANCQAEGGWLAAPTSKRQNTAIFSLLRGRAWLGYNSTAGYWATPTGASMNYSSWDRNQPDNDRTFDPAGQQCVQVLYPSQGWDDAWCNDPEHSGVTGYVCQRPCN